MATLNNKDPERFVGLVCDYIESLKLQIPKWISVGERMPEAGSIVLGFRAASDAPGHAVVRWDGTHWIDDTNGIVGAPYSHWMELPKGRGE